MGKEKSLRSWLWVGLSVGLLATATALAPRAALAAEQAEALDDWRPATEAEQELVWRVVLHSPLGIAALNQLAIEGFISPQCDQRLYTHPTFETFQTLLRVSCPTPRGVSTARAYDEMRVTFNRFEDTIESFELERIYTE
jgi:hypothetical protein